MSLRDGRFAALRPYRWRPHRERYRRRPDTLRQRRSARAVAMLRSLEVPDEPSLARALERELADQLPPGSRIIPWRRGADFFALRVVPPDGAAELVLRVPLREITTSVHDGTVDFGGVVEREAFVHGLLERHSVPIASTTGSSRRTQSTPTPS
jgi:hypothetical protein